ncbi:EF-Tu/IF-2/RF-3 family GTPase [Candidatus Altiarchaeota archaeon]
MSVTGNVSFTYGQGLAGLLGKKGTSSDITLYNTKLGDSVLTFIEATGFPEKIQPLISAINISDQALVRIDSLDGNLAETIMALDHMGMEKGFLIYGKDVREDQVAPLIEDTVIQGYEVLEEQPMVLKEKLAGLVPDPAGDPVVQVDHSFQVKGVGTVALGVVKSGTVKKYDVLDAVPGDVKVPVKSIQVHDTDVPEAVAGVRVGLALKDAKPDDIPRGTILTTGNELRLIKEGQADASLSKYAGKALEADDIIMVNSMLNYTPARIASGSLDPGKTGKIVFELEKEVPTISGNLCLMDPGQKPPRILGHLKI